MKRILRRISGTLNALAIVAIKPSALPLGSTSVQVPPAPSIASRAVALNPCADTTRFLRSSAPRPRIFTGTCLRVASPRARSVSGVTSAPSSNRFRSARFTGWVWVRNGSNGIDFFMCGPRSFRILMCSGIWPPS